MIQIGTNSEQLIINARQLSSILKSFYEICLNFEELKKLRRSFRHYDNINEAMINIYEIFDNKKYAIQKENDSIYLILKINRGISGEENINIELKTKKIQYKIYSRIYARKLLFKKIK